MTLYNQSAVSKSPDAGALLELLQKQADLYRQLRQLSVEQGELVSNAQPEALLGLLSRRQALIDQLAVVDADLTAFRQSWDRVISTLDASQREHVKGLVNEVQESLGAIVAQDEADRQKLQTAKDQISSQRSHMTQAGAAARAYGAQPGANLNSNHLTNQQG